MLPEIIRRTPRRELVVRYSVRAALLPSSLQALHAAADVAQVRCEPIGEMRWQILVDWHTMVLGFVRRDVDETVFLELAARPDGTELRLTCRPDGTHGAHATGCAGVLVLATVAWIAGGLTAGLAAAFTTAAAGGLLADTMREMALRVLARRLRRLAEDLGSAMWPEIAAEVVDAMEPRQD